MRRSYGCKGCTNLCYMIAKDGEVWTYCRVIYDQPKHKGYKWIGEMLYCLDKHPIRKPKTSRSECGLRQNMRGKYMNKVTLLGRLTKDPELRKTMSGDSFTSFQIAVKRPRSKDKTDFIGCVAWNKAAELICTYVKKGQQIGITGMLQTRSYERDGSTTRITEVYVEEFDFVGKSDAYAQASGIPDEALPF